MSSDSGVEIQERLLILYSWLIDAQVLEQSGMA